METKTDLLEQECVDAPAGVEKERDILNTLLDEKHRDVRIARTVFFDLVGDLIAGWVLNEIVYWSQPGGGGRKHKMVAHHDGVYWYACPRHGWWERIRVSAEQADRALEILTDARLVEKRVYKWFGEPTTHVRLTPTFCEKAIPLAVWEAENPRDKRPPTHPKDARYAKRKSKKPRKGVLV